MKRTNLQKVLLGFMTVLLILALSLSVFAMPFTDVEPWLIDNETFDSINYVYDNKIMQGTSNTTFRPDNLLSRGMFVTVLYRISGSTEKYSNPFTDVPNGEYYTYPVGWANHYEIVLGKTSTKFAPNDPITRE